MKNLKKPETILVVDIHDISRAAQKSVLKRLRPDDVVQEAFDGAEAVQLCKSGNPILVTLSTSLPKIDGITAARMIKAANRDIQMLLFSSTVSSSELLTVLETGAIGYCQKDCPTSLLTAALSSVFSGALWIDPRVAEDVVGPLVKLLKPGNVEAAIQSPILSERELEVLALLVSGLSNKQMADKLGVGVETIKTHMRHVMEKLSVTDRTQAAIKALRMGLLH